MKQEAFPILEFDPDRNAIIRPSNLVKKIDIPERCVITFFLDEMEKIVKEYPSKVIEYFKCDAYKLPIYEVNYEGIKIALIQGMVGAPVAARQIEDLVERGCKKFLVCGDCGVLDKDIVSGHLILPVAAIRDEGTSYHYIAPSREIEMDKDVLKILETVLKKNHLPYLKTKTWTTDAFFRETQAKTIRRKNEGCLVVEMESAAYMAVAKFNNVKLGQILYAGDNLDGNIWDNRKLQDKQTKKELL
ncbi:MAG: nucleoside phosphorylase [Bacilli bacterium]|nr:nucleoside phosphorylase [Bacilli bacterium]